MSNIFRKFWEGLSLKPRTSTTANEMGDLEVISGTGKLQYHNGTTVSPIVTADHNETLKNKTIVVDNAISGNTITTKASGNLSAVELNAALTELQTDIDTRALNSDLTTHIGATTGAHAASAISVVPTGNIASTTTQAALVEIQGDVDTINSKIGSVNGIATLDGGGKVPATQLPNSVMEFQGYFNPNTSTLVNGTGNAGDVWEADTVGSCDFGAGAISFKVGDWAVYASGIWHKSLNSNEVTSVAGKTGTVTLVSSDVGLGNVTNVSQLPLSYLDTDVTLVANSDTKVASQKATKTYANAQAIKYSIVFG
jgi:hypothetical protein